MELAEKQAGANDTNQDLQAMQIQQDTVNLVREQLDLSEQLDVIEHLLRGHILGMVKVPGTDTEVQQWIKPSNDDMIILTDYGVHLIMNTITFYLNKNTLLSNYDEKTIDNKMEDFSTALADVIFMEYEKVFKYPSTQDCIDVLKERIQRKTDLRKFALETIGKKADEKEIEDGFLKEIEDRIENELSKIKEQVIKNKLKRFEIIIREVQDSVHSTYLRAWKGQERRTLREHIHTTESLGGINQQPRMQRSSSGSRLNPMNLFRRG